jgi:hypothetical protein
MVSSALSWCAPCYSSVVLLVRFLPRNFVLSIPEERYNCLEKVQV